MIVVRSLILISLALPSLSNHRTKRQYFDPYFGPPSGPQQDFGPSGSPSGFGGPPFGPPPPGYRPQRPQGSQDDDNGPPLRPGYRPQRPQGGQGPPGFRPQLFDPQRPQGYRPYQNNPYTFGGLDPLGGLGKALESIARYDDKRCVARMLCEVSAGGTPGGYRSDSGLFDLSGLRGIADLLGAMTESPAASPMLMFGRAALLGATMRDPYRCYSSYPQCPRDPDRLVDYLNNHNGGFFKFFSPQGGNSQDVYTTRRPPYNRRGKKLRKQKYPDDDKDAAEDNKRIQNDVPISDRTGTGELRLDTAQLEQGTRDGKSLRFPRQGEAVRSSGSSSVDVATPSSDSAPQASSRSEKIVFPTP